MPCWPLGFAHSRFPDLEDLGKRLRIEAGSEHLPKSSGLALKCPAASLQRPFSRRPTCQQSFSAAPPGPFSSDGTER